MRPLRFVGCVFNFGFQFGFGSDIAKIGRKYKFCNEWKSHLRSRIQHTPRGHALLYFVFFCRLLILLIPRLWFYYLFDLHKHSLHELVPYFFINLIFLWSYGRFVTVYAHQTRIPWFTIEPERNETKWNKMFDHKAHMMDNNTQTLDRWTVMSWSGEFHKKKKKKNRNFIIYSHEKWEIRNWDI